MHCTAKCSRCYFMRRMKRCKQAECCYYEVHPTAEPFSVWAAVRQCGAWLLFLQLSSGRAEGTATSRDKTSSLRVLQYLYHIFAVYMTAHLQSGADSVRSVVGIGKLMVLCMPP